MGVKRNRMSLSVFVVWGCDKTKHESKKSWLERWKKICLGEEDMLVGGGRFRIGTR